MIVAQEEGDDGIFLSDKIGIIHAREGFHFTVPHVQSALARGYWYPPAPGPDLELAQEYERHAIETGKPEGKGDA